MSDKEIGDLIKKIRFQHKLSSKDFGARYNVSFQTVARWERANPLPEDDILLQICEDFNIDLKLMMKRENLPLKRKTYMILNSIPILIIISTIVLFIIRIIK